MFRGGQKTINQKINKKVGLIDHKHPTVLKPRFCQDCPDSKVHEIGSTLWLSCRFQSGLRDFSAQCNLPGETLRGDNH